MRPASKIPLLSCGLPIALCMLKWRGRLHLARVATSPSSVFSSPIRCEGSGPYVFAPLVAAGPSGQLVVERAKNCIVVLDQ
jgi:hypothetical protein